MLTSLKIKKPKIRIIWINSLCHFSPKNMILIELLYVINIQWIIDLVGLPPVITRIDAIIALILIGWQSNKILNYIKKSNLFAFFFIFYTITNIIGSLFNGFNPIYVLWTFLKNYIFFFFLIACIVSLNKEDFFSLMETLCKFHVLNFGLCMYQYFIFMLLLCVAT